MTSIPAAPIVVPLVIIGAVALARVARRAGSPLSWARVTTIAAATLYAAAVVLLTVLPLQVQTGEYGNHASWTGKLQLIPVLTIDVDTFALNVIMMLPLGVLLPLVLGRIRWGRVVAVAFAVSLGIEVLQGVTNVVVSSGRAADVNDLIANTAGAVLGFALLELMVRSAGGAALVERFMLAPGRVPAEPGTLRNGTAPILIDP